MDEGGRQEILNFPLIPVFFTSDGFAREKETFLGTVRCIGLNKNEIDTTKILHQQCNITGKI